MDRNDTEHSDAFIQFVTRSRPGLRRSAYLLCGDWHEAEDLTQNALLAVLRRWDGLDRPEAAAGYARAAMYRIFVSDRRRARWASESVRADLPDRPVIDESQSSVADRIVLFAALRELPPRQRATVVLRYFEDLDVARTAEIMESEPSTIRSQTTRALATMRRIMRNHH